MTIYRAPSFTFKVPSERQKPAAKVVIHELKKYGFRIRLQLAELTYCEVKTDVTICVFSQSQFYEVI